MGSLYNAFCKDCADHFTFHTGGGFTYYQLICKDCGSVKSVPRYKSKTNTGVMDENGVGAYLATPLLWSKDGIKFEPEEQLIIERLTCECSCGGQMLFEKDPSAQRRCQKCKGTNLAIEDSGILRD